LATGKTTTSLKIAKGFSNLYIEEGQTTQWPKENVQKDKQRSTKHYTENYRSSNGNPTKIRRSTQLLLKDKQFLLHMWRP
jgi:hypothetical protein